MRIGLLLLCLFALPALAEPSRRGGTSEWSLNLFLDGSRSYEFEGGQSLRIDGGYGLGFTWAHNFNEYFALGSDATFGVFDYRSRVTPASGNTGAAFDTFGTMETATLRLHATWYLLARPVTPFLTAGAGVTIVDTNLGDATLTPSGCWSYPWYGVVCNVAPGHTLNRLSYGAALGMRFDLAHERGFIRAMVGGEWIDLPDTAGSAVGYGVMRVDFGIRF
jgi:hypothetical protein